MLQIFVTGGTFDKEYNYLTGKLFFKNTHLSEMLEHGRCTVPIDVKTLMMIDSLEMTDADRAVIALNCQKTSADQIIITHGTDTMVDTAKYLVKQVSASKTIILTGAMIPYAFGSSSDGFFNLGSAIAYAQALAPGIYIVMNGQCFHYDNVTKNYETGNFQKLHP